MHLTETRLPGVFIIHPDVYTDFRGDNVMVWNKRQYEAQGLPEFIEHNLFTGHKGMLSGVHYSPFWKLYECVYGKVYYAFVDVETGKWESFILSDANHHQLVKPPQYATALLVLSDYAVVHVLQSEYYDASDPNQKTYRYDDPKFKLWFPKITPEYILSKRDEQGEYESRITK